MLEVLVFVNFVVGVVVLIGVCQLLPITRYLYDLKMLRMQQMGVIGTIRCKYCHKDFFTGDSVPANCPLCRHQFNRAGEQINRSLVGLLK